MKSIVKIVYPGKELKLATEDGYESMDLLGRELDLEVCEERRCVGFHSERGEMTPCPEFRKIESGDQCQECRRKDIYTSWRKGESSPEFEASYSVYLALCGSKVKVGVSRSSRLQQRWREQGADFAAEIESGLSGEEALETEKEISSQGIKERIRKEHKLKEADSRDLRENMRELEIEAEIEAVHANKMSASKLVRKGPIPSPVKSIQGQIVSDARLAMAITSGKVVKKKQQKNLESY
ncbi:MAG: DUF2797 domain-containing protein [Candidatus Nanohaloarchaea archaeon]